MSHGSAVLQSAPSVCLGNGNPNRLVSLWDIVNRFKPANFCIRVGNFEVFEARFAHYQPSTVEAWAQLMIEFAGEIIHAANDCHDIGMESAWAEIDRVNSSLEGNTNPQVCVVAARHIRHCLIDELEKRKFLYVRPDHSNFVDSDALFGDPVKQAFPSAARDLKEAGNCLAADGGTGSVFHLMRAAEFALRALARDRDLAFKDKPLEDKQWGEILSALEGKLTVLRNADRKSWALAEARDAQIRFYNEVVQELRGFNDAWRRHISHADTQAFYESDTALGILKHVRAFMQKLSVKIPESSITPEFWISA